MRCLAQVFLYLLTILIINIWFQINRFSWVSAFQLLTFLIQELFVDGGMSDFKVLHEYRQLITLASNF